MPEVPNTRAQSSGVWQACVCPLARHRTERCSWVCKSGRGDVCFSSPSPTQDLNTLLLRMGPDGTSGLEARRQSAGEAVISNTAFQGHHQVLHSQWHSQHKPMRLGEGACIGTPQSLQRRSPPVLLPKPETFTIGRQDWAMCPLTPTGWTKLREKLICVCNHSSPDD